MELREETEKEALTWSVGDKHLAEGYGNYYLVMEGEENLIAVPQALCYFHLLLQGLIMF